MKITLREFLESDLPALETWAKAIGSRNYMSNYRPATGIFGKARGGRKLLWRVISVSGTDAGSVWIEESEDRKEAVLGILLGKNSLLGRGIGKAAIALALKEAQAVFPSTPIVLHVRTNNQRAIACYTACGFAQTATGLKTNSPGQQIPFITMSYLPKNT